MHTRAGLVCSMLLYGTISLTGLLVGGCGGRPAKPRADVGWGGDCGRRAVSNEQTTDIGVTIQSVLSGTLHPRTLRRRPGSSKMTTEANVRSCLTDSKDVRVEFLSAKNGTTGRCELETRKPFVNFSGTVRIAMPNCAEIVGECSVSLSNVDQADFFANGTLAELATRDRFSVTGRFTRNGSTLDLLLWNESEPQPTFRGVYVSP